MERRRLTAGQATKTYRYLRLGMVGAVVLLAASIVIEHVAVGDCWQTSISAYYYTPVRAIFVGALMVVSFALIVIKGRTPSEDGFLNAAGMMAPIVAVAPTTDVGRCWSVPPNPLPINPDGSLAGWVTSNVENNFHALLIAAALGLVVSVVIAVLDDRGVGGPREPLGATKILMFVGNAVALLAGWWAIVNWDDFFTKAHGYSAVALFVFLIHVVAGRAYAHRNQPTRAYFWLYTAVTVVMVAGGGFFWLSRIFEEHTVFAVETLEISAFALFWLVQTWESWGEGALTDAPLPAQEA